MSLRWRKATLACLVNPGFNVCFCPTCVSTTLPSYVKCSTPSITSSPSMTEAVLVEFTLRILWDCPFPRCIFRPRWAKCCFPQPLVFSCIYYWEWERRPKSSVLILLCFKTEPVGPYIICVLTQYIYLIVWRDFDSVNWTNIWCKGIRGN